MCEVCGVEGPVVGRPYFLKESKSLKAGRMLAFLNFSDRLISKIDSRLPHARYSYKYFFSRLLNCCSVCGSATVAPSFTEEELDCYYDSAYWGSYEVAADEDKSLGRAYDHWHYVSKHLDLPKIGVMLDFGAGAAISALYFRDRMANSKVICLDKSSQTEARCLDVGLSYVARLEELNDKVDFIYSSHSLEHVVDIVQVMSELKKSLNSGGYIFIEVPNISSSEVRDSEYHLPHTYCFTEQGLVSLLESNGFDILDTSEAGDDWSSFLNTPDLKGKMYLRVIAKKVI